MMQRIRAVLDKLNVLSQRKSDRSVIDIDLMLDYTRMVYADLLDMRATLAAKTELNNAEPTLDELTAAMTRKETVAALPTTPPAPQQPVMASAAPAYTITKDIRQSIDLNEKYLLLSELFRNDMHAYEEAMKVINSLKTENEALQWIGARQWPTNDDALITFRELLKRFYAS